MRRYHQVFLVICFLGGLSSPGYSEVPSRPSDVVSLFDGGSLEGWRGDPRLWRVEEGAITGQTSADHPLEANTFLIWDGDVSDFRLQLKYRIQGGNSGVQYRAKVLDADKHAVGGYQADIDSGPNYTAIMYEEQGRGIIALRGQTARIDAKGTLTKSDFGEAGKLQEVIHTDDQWNDYMIEAIGQRLRHYVNGVLMTELVDEEEVKRSSSGVLALQLHAGPPMKVQFRDLTLEQLSTD
jgi:hypothetical protein